MVSRKARELIPALFHATYSFRKEAGIVKGS